MDATIEDIKKSYRTLSKQHHPDRPDGDAEKFKSITGAYEVLSDIDKRKQLDATILGNISQLNPPFTTIIPPMNTATYNPIHIHNPINHIELDIYCNITVDLPDLYRGTIKKFKVNRYQYSNTSQPILEEKYLEVKIPPGFPSGECLILLREGNKFRDEIAASMGNIVEQSGNIIIKVIESNKTLFRRDGINLIYPVKISLRRALCGFQLNIIHLDGRKLTISIDEVISPGMQHIISKEGMPNIIQINIPATPNEKAKGDLIIVFDVEFPLQLSKDRKDLLNRILQ